MVEGLLAIQWLLFYVALRALKGATHSMCRARRPWLLLGIGAFFQILMLGHGAIQEHDAYRYLWDGATLAQGVSPIATNRKSFWR